MARETGYVHVVANLEFLDLTALLLDEFLDDKAADGVAGVALTRVRLNDDTAVHPRRMVLLVLRAVVRVDGVAHVAADEEGARNGLRICSRARGETLQEEGNEGGLSAGRGDGADLLMVEKCDAVHVALEDVEARRGCEVGDGLDCTEPGEPGKRMTSVQGRTGTYEENWLSIRGLKMNSLFRPPSTDGCVSYKCLSSGSQGCVRWGKIVRTAQSHGCILARQIVR